MSVNRAHGTQSVMGQKPSNWPSELWLAVAALVWAVAVGVLFLVVPTGQSVTRSSTGGSDQITRHTLVENEGLGVVLVLAVPVLIAAIGVVGARTRDARVWLLSAGSVLLAACVLAAASIGLPYVPSVIALLIAGRLSSARASPRSEPGPRSHRHGSGFYGRQRIVQLFAVWWMVAGATLSGLSFSDVNADARVLVGAASIAGPFAAGTAAWLMRGGGKHLRTAGALLVLSALITPTYMAWPVNVVALAIGALLLVGVGALRPVDGIPTEKAS